MQAPLLLPHESQTTVNQPCMFSQATTPAPAAETKKKENSIPLTSHNLSLNLLFQPIPRILFCPTHPAILRLCLFYQCLIRLTNGPCVTRTRLPLVKIPAGCLGVTLSPLPPLWPGSHQLLQHQPEGNRVGEQTKIIPADRAGSVLTFCKWFPFIKAAHEWLVVVRCTLYLPDTSTAFWTHLIKQIVNMQLVLISFHSPSQIPGDLSNVKY